MSLNAVPSGERIHIAFFGLRNAGKSSLVNAVTGQSLSIVSDVRGTTTDPVRKAMELLPIGPVVIIDTPGIDDEGELGTLRVKKAEEILSGTDVAVLVRDITKDEHPLEKELVEAFRKKNIPYITVYNKADMSTEKKETAENEIIVSALTGENIYELKELIAKAGKTAENTRVIVSDIISEGDTVILVIPIDKSAPKGRLILPQQMTIRDILDKGAFPYLCSDVNLKDALDGLKKPPSLVITDSQVFGKVAAVLPDNIPLTSFSILMARYKGDLPRLMEGAKALSELRDGDKVLISEGCTHHRQCEDIGSVKIPMWIEKFTGAKPEYSFTSGGEFPSDLSSYKLIVHCGGCMLNEKEMKSRTGRAVSQGVPIVNYGIAIADMHGILERSVQPFFKD